MAKKPKKIKDDKVNGAKGEKGKPIKGINAKRDPVSGAVVSTDSVGYQKAIKRKRAGRNILLQQRKMATQENRIAALEKQVANILDLLDG